VPLPFAAALPKDKPVGAQLSADDYGGDDEEEAESKVPAKKMLRKSGKGAAVAPAPLAAAAVAVVGGAIAAPAAAAVAESKEDRAWWQAQWKRIVSLKLGEETQRKLQAKLLARADALRFFLEIWADEEEERESLRADLVGMP
jgi:hypothetical protein